MSDINPFVNWNLHNTNEVLSPEKAKALRDSCLDDSEKLIQCFSPKFEEHQAALERQVEAIEKIANEAKNQSVSSSELATEAKKQSESSKQIADSAKTQADIAKKEAAKADWNSRIALLIAILTFLLEVIVNHQDIITFFQSVVTSLQSILQTA